MIFIHIYATTMNVRQLREQKGLSQQELAAMTGIPKDRIAKWEQGKGAPKAEDSRILDKYFKEIVPRAGKSATTATETPQNGQKSEPLTLIGQMVKDIQYATNLTIEDIAERIRYSRPHLTVLLKQGESEKVVSRLQKEFKEVLTHSTKYPVFDAQTPQNGKDHVIRTQSETVKSLADTSKSQQETISKLTDLVTKLVQK